MYGLSVFLMFSCRVVSKRSVRSYSSGSTKKLLEFLADMPKATSTRIAESQRQRQQIAKKFEKYTPSTVYLQVLGSGARGAPNTLYLFTDQKRYLFNCGECTQRLAHEHKVKLSRLDHIFITSKTWRNIGGLPGLSLTLQDVGVPNITLHGPEGLDELYAATKRFVIMKDMQVTMANCSPCEDFSDNVMTVKYVLLSPNENILPTTSDQSAKKQKPDSNSNKEYEEFGHDETDYYRPEQRNLESSTCLGKQGKERGKAKANGLEKDAVKKKTEKYLHELQQKSKCSIAYICTLKKRPGTLDLTKCVERGVKPGPLLGMLKNGQDVVLPDGTIVLSKDVKSPDDPGPVFIVLDVPELTYLKESEFSSHFDNGENPAENIPTVIVHFTPPHVFHHPTYRAFMAAFGPSPRHLILNAQNSCLGSEAVHRTQQKLHLLDPDIFPLLRDVSVPAVWNAQPPMPKTNSPLRLKGLEELKNKIALAQFQNIINLEGSAKGDGHPLAVPEGDSVSKMELIAGRTLTMFHLRPKKQLDRSAEPKLHIQDYIQETMDVDGFVGSLEQFRRLVDSMRYVRNESKEFPKVVFLGTGSCIPSKTRNTSAIVLQIDENHSMLLDCGEGTFGQLVRFYGPKKVNAFLRTLNAIYISHLHADHHIGLIGVIQARREAMLELEGAEPPAPLYLLAPGQIVTWLTLYHTQFEKLKSDYTLIPNQNLVHDHQQQEGVSSAVLAAIGVQSITTCFVAHCPNAFGVAIQVDNDRYKMTYSGDTLPCEELVKIGENSTLLIHEATMEDELADEARMKMHSTTTQAIDIGRQMNAKYTVLTHFSQRYARLPRLNAHILNNNNSVGIAFDNMQITMSDLELLPHMYAPLQLMFAEHCVELEMKAAQRQRHREQHAVPPSTPGNLESIHSLNLNQLAAPNGSVNLVPAKRPRYRESNASRLRQELKGMKVSGYVRIPRSMSSKSNSASESGWPMSKRTTPMNLTPPNTSRQPSMERTVGRSRKAKRKEVFQREKSPESLPHSKGNFLMKDFALKSYRNTSSDPMCLDRPCRTANGIMDFINQSRPRSSHTSCRPESSIGRINSFELSYTPRRMNLPLDTQGTSACNNVESGYGKPLMTQLSKRLTIRKDHPWSCDNGREKMTTAFGNSARSPNRSNKAQKRESISPNASVQRTKLFSTKIPTKVTESGNRLRESNTSPNVLPDTKIPMARTNLGVKSLEPSSSSLHGTRRNSRSPLRQPKSQETSGDKANATNYRWSTEQRENGPLEIINKFPERNRTPSRSPIRNGLQTANRFTTADEKRKASKDVHQVAEKLNLSSKKEPSATPLTRPATPLTEPASPLTRPASPMTRPALSLTRPVSPLTRPASPVTTPASSLTRPASPLTRPASTLTKQNPSVYSNRSFKPHLEDIKSSYLLVNKISQDSAKTVAKAEKYLHNEASHVVNQFNEDRRRHMLIECKKKVQSPTFRANSRFEKIEGLNWIPWKQTKVKL